MKPWVCGTTGIPVQYTPFGRSWNENDGSMGATANAVFLANVYGQVIPVSMEKEVTKCFLLFWILLID